MIFIDFCAYHYIIYESFPSPLTAQYKLIFYSRHWSGCLNDADKPLEAWVINYLLDSKKGLYIDN